MNRSDFEIEICAGSIKSVIEAEKGGANRVELCDNLYEGGTTPSLGTFIQAKKSSAIDIFPIIRPRGGDFLYSEEEFKIMLQDIKLLKAHGADGIVIGCLTANGEIDYDMCARLVEVIDCLSVTFHRAFDLTENPYKSFEVLKKLGISRLLTSGQANKAEDGVDLIAELVKMAGNDIKIMVGAGVSENNIETLVRKTGASAYHASLRKAEESKMQYRKNGIFMGGLPQIPEYSYSHSNSERVKRLIQIIGNL